MLRLLDVQGPEPVRLGVDRVGDKPLDRQVMPIKQLSPALALKGQEPELGAVLRCYLPMAVGAGDNALIFARV